MNKNLDYLPMINYILAMGRERETLGKDISGCLKEIRVREGWSIDDLSNYLEINNLTIRNSLSRNVWSDLVVVILKLKNVIPEALYHEYRKEIEREKIEKRKQRVASV